MRFLGSVQHVQSDGLSFPLKIKSAPKLKIANATKLVSQFPNDLRHLVQSQVLRNSKAKDKPLRDLTKCFPKLILGLVKLLTFFIDDASYLKVDLLVAVSPEIRPFPRFFQARLKLNFGAPHCEVGWNLKFR